MKLTDKLTLRQKLVAGLSGMVVFFLLVAVFNLYQVHQIKQELQKQNDKVELKLMALELKEMVQELNIIASGLEISKNPDYIPAYNEKRALFDQMIKRIGDTANTDEQSLWRSKLILLTGEFTNTFDVASKVITDNALKRDDIDKNMEYLYNESQRLMKEIFVYVDRFYNSYSDDAAAAVASTQKKLNSTVSIMIGALIAATLISLAIAVILIRSLLPPIQRLQTAVKLVASGDFRIRINNRSSDELGALSRDFDHMIEQVRSMLLSTQAIASSLSSHSSLFREFSGSTASANKDIVRAIQEISAGAEQQAHYTEQSSTIVGELAQQVHEIAAATDTMQRMSREASFHTHTGSHSMEELRTAAKQSEEVLHHVFAAMDTLSSSSAQIGKIVGTITEISTQTNVLALNAAIEAARAGVHGKGFSVIAEEVRLLSAQTNDSSRMIGFIVKSLMTQIKELETSLTDAKQSFAMQNGKMKDSMEAFRKIRQSMDELSGQILHIHDRIASVREKNKTIVESIQHVAAIAEETAAGVQEVNSSSLQQDSAIHQIASESEDILELAQRLFAEINRFKIKNDGEFEIGLQDVPAVGEEPRTQGAGVGQKDPAVETPKEELPNAGEADGPGMLGLPVEGLDEQKDKQPADAKEAEEKKLQPV